MLDAEEDPRIGGIADGISQGRRVPGVEENPLELTPGLGGDLLAEAHQHPVQVEITLQLDVFDLGIHLHLLSSTRRRA